VSPGSGISATVVSEFSITQPPPSAVAVAASSGNAGRMAVGNSMYLAACTRSV